MVQLCFQQLQMEQYVYGRSVNTSQDVLHISAIPELLSTHGSSHH